MSSAPVTCLGAFKLVIPSLLENLALFQALANPFFLKGTISLLFPSLSHGISFSTAHFLYKASVQANLVPTKSTWQPKTNKGYSTSDLSRVSPTG